MYRWQSVLVFVLGFVIAGPALGQSERGRQRNPRRAADRKFEKSKPAVGDRLPTVSVYDPDGNKFETDSLRGSYTVLTFGCLT